MEWLFIAVLMLYAYILTRRIEKLEDHIRTLKTKGLIEP